MVFILDSMKSSMNNDYESIKRNKERLCEMFGDEVVKYSLFSYANFSTELTNQADRKKWREMIRHMFEHGNNDRVMGANKAEKGINFPRCVLNEKQLMKLAQALECKFPLKIYTNGRHIIIRTTPNNEHYNAYNSMNAIDCIVEPLRIEGLYGFNVPILVRMRLLYMPNADNWISITYTGKGCTRLIKRTDDPGLCIYDDVGRCSFIGLIRFVPFEVMKWLSAHEPNDEKNDLISDYENYVNAWCDMITFNVTGNNY